MALNNVTRFRIRQPFTNLGVILLSIFALTCTNDAETPKVDCNTSTLSIQLVAKTNPGDCATADGTIEVSASGGGGTYQFKLGTGSYGSSGLFSNLTAGSYTATVKDANGCEKVLTGISLSVPNGPVIGASTINHQTNCLAPNGSITANVSGGTGSYQYKLNSGSFGSSATFPGLKAGSYTITVKDDAGCTVEINETINSQTGVSYLNDIKPILEANCIKSGCHNGDNGADKNWSVFSNVQAKAALIKLRTGNKSMPADIAPTGLPQSQIDLIACWVDDGAQNN